MLLDLDLNVGVIIIIGLASFRLTRLFLYDKIMEFVRAPFFEEVTELDENGVEEIYLVPKKSGLRNWIGQLLSCYWCTGIWISAFLICGYYFIPEIGVPLIMLLAVAAIGSIIETIIGRIVGN